MDQWFVIGLGVLVAVFNVPPIIAASRHREYCLGLMTRKFCRRFGVAPIILGLLALLVSGHSENHHRMLFLMGVIGILSGIFLLVAPDLIIVKVRFLCSRSLGLWVARGILKFSMGLGVVYWGIFSF